MATVTPPSRRTRWLVSLRVRAWGLAAAVVLAFLIWLGSERFHVFDSALIGYTVAVVALTFAVVARYARWLRMPSTGRYWRRGWELASSFKAFRSVPALLPRAVAGQLLGQGFIRRRGIVRWVAHQCLFWGVIGATLITFPLVFGWLSFRLAPNSFAHYRAYVFGFGTVDFPTSGFVAWSAFHALDYTAVLVIFGASIFLWRRFRDRGVMSTQSLGYDMVPLVMLMVIAATGILLTLDEMFLHGSYYELLSVVHMGSVVFALVFIPFGKFFHVLQRPASVGIQLYTEVNSQGGRQACAECGEPLAPPVFLADLRSTLDELGQDYRLAGTTRPAVPGGAFPGDVRRASDVDESLHALPAHLTDLCPRCRRQARARAFFDTNGRSFAR